MKECTSCHELKPLEAFGSFTDKRRGTSGLRWHCRGCATKAAVKWAQDNPDKNREKGRRLYHLHKEDPGFLEARRAANREIQRRRRSTEAGKQWERDKQREHRFKDPVPHMIRAARGRAREKGLPFDLDKEWGYATWGDGCCSLTGIKFEHQIVRQSSRSPSIDRIKPSLGYVKSNCRFVLSAVNSLKGASEDEEMFVIAKALIENRR
jgi:hypothetical protein